MKNIVILPLVSHDKDFIYCGVEARRKFDNARRSVFAFPSGRSFVYSFGSIFLASGGNPAVALFNADAKMKRIADTLNKWIPARSERELNKLLPLIDREDTDNFTKEQKLLWVKYKLCE